MPLRLPDKLPAIELLKHENIFVMDESRAHNQEIRQYASAVGGLLHEVEEPYSKEYADRTHDDVL